MLRPFESLPDQDLIDLFNDLPKESRFREGIVKELKYRDVPRHVPRRAVTTEEPIETEQTRTHFYRDVPGLGNIAVSRHAQARMIAEGITQKEFDRTLLMPEESDIPEGNDILWRQRHGVRIVIITDPTPNVGAMLVKTVFRIEAQAQAK